MAGAPDAVSVRSTDHATPPRRAVWWPWFAWLAAFYAVWLGLQLSLGTWEQTKAHWPIAVAMALGSYVAGSTPMGGGTIGFPMLVLLFELPPGLGRNFALAIQSIGMTSATIFILCLRIPIEGRVILWSLPPAAMGLLVGTSILVPMLDDTIVKLIFACLWMSFAVLTWLRNRELCALRGRPELRGATARKVGLLVGLSGGITTALTGVGIDMILYSVLVLSFRCELVTAIASSVVLMASTSLMGVGLHLSLGDIQPEVFANWLAASPVVILGAPLGAYLVTLISRARTMWFVAFLCAFSFVWTLARVELGPTQIVFVIANLIVAGLIFSAMDRSGRARHDRVVR
ncbi:sulfite exporter TauE/SafE family protein [Paraliomyxa miuraensis]|uniref:sulfite exporter TauE/SafE family protein n=1 Tax=Paraliomyxa miuraensis TaxID=376150 RepID=UPI00224D0791|nr:sulfite exporter TauE/SafE family protein [Paraliomyxa miuraensis]MCX4243213.1 sulfite exporter TauE/SafE family protein [Paraliomyxa miuraensis]